MQEVQGRLDDQKQLLRACDKDISERAQEQQALHKQVNQVQLQVQETEHKLSKMTKDSRDAARQVGDGGLVCVCVCVCVNCVCVCVRACGVVCVC